jgi:MFS family permease
LVFNAVLIGFEVPTGALADRIGRRITMMLGSLAMASAFLAYYAGASFGAFVGAEALFALGMTLVSGPDSAYLYDLLKEQGVHRRYGAYEGTASAWKHVGMTAAFAVGGFLGQRQAALPFGVAAALCACAALVAWQLREAPPATRLRARWGGYGNHIARALRSVLARPRLRSAIAYSALVFVLLRIGLWLYQPYLTDAGLDVAQTGLVFAGLYLLAALCSRGFDRIRARLPGGSIVWVLPAVLAVSYLVLGRFCALWGIALLATQKGVDGLYSPLTKEMLNREIEDSAERATVLSAESMVRRLLFSLFAPACGMLFDRFGRSAAYELCGVVGLLAVGHALWGRQRLVDAPRHAAEEGAASLRAAPAAAMPVQTVVPPEPSAPSFPRAP